MRIHPMQGGTATARHGVTFIPFLYVTKVLFCTGIMKYYS